MSSSLPHLQKTPPIVTKVSPDSGASICLAGTSDLRRFKLTKNQLIPCSKRVTVVGRSTLICFGWLPMTFSIANLKARQPLFFREEANRIYLSCKACIKLSILPPSYPHPMISIQQESVHTSHSPKAQRTTILGD